MSRELPEHGTVSDEGDQPPYLEKKICAKYIFCTFMLIRLTFYQMPQGSLASKDIHSLRKEVY